MAAPLAGLLAAAHPHQDGAANQAKPRRNSILQPEDFTGTGGKYEPAGIVHRGEFRLHEGGNQPDWRGESFTG
ncbi:hypothetical protein AB2F28_06850 [Escherichia coli]